MTGFYNEYHITTFQRWSVTEFLSYKKENVGDVQIERNLKWMTFDIKIPVADDTKELRNKIRNNESQEWMSYEPDNYEDSGGNAELHIDIENDEELEKEILRIFNEDGQYDEDEPYNSAWDVEDFCRENGFSEDGYYHIEGKITMSKFIDGELKQFDD